MLGKFGDLPVAELLDDIDPYADLNREGEIFDGHKWQPQRIVDEQKTPSGLEYEVSIVKKLWWNHMVIPVHCLSTPS